MTLQFELNDRVQRSPSTEGEATAGDYYVLDLDSGKYYSLGEVGGFVWERLDGCDELAVLVDAVAREFEVAPAEAGRDLLEFIESLSELGLIKAGAAG